MDFLHLPRFLRPRNLDEIMERQQVRPLNYCSKCNYVLCSCRHCHSEVCRETCLYETGEMAWPPSNASTKSEAGDGKVWCDECNGYYLPHVH